jgi:hypothetical protein
MVVDSPQLGSPELIMCGTLHDHSRALLFEDHTTGGVTSNTYDDYAPLPRYVDAAYSRSYETADTALRN